MKIFLFHRKKRIVAMLLGMFIFALLLVNVVGYFLDMKYMSVFAASAEINKYEIRSTLLMDAMNSVGVCIPERAAEVWANGLKARSAAMQYSVMTKNLKDQYAQRLEQTFPNWVTGVSSPWIDKFQLVSKQQLEKNIYVFRLRFSTRTSTGPAGDYNASLMVVKDGDFWRISKIETDPELKVYTGF